MNTAMLAIAGSVAMHVAWNLLVRQQGAKTRLLWWALATHCLILAPWGFYALVTQAHWTPQLALVLLASSLANVAYFVALDRAYHHAPVALVYPIVRSSPLLIAIWSLLLFGESLGVWAWLAMLLSVAGLMLLASTAWRNDARAALPWALAAALATSVYSLTDKAATPFLPTLSSVLGFISVGYALSFIAITVLLRREHGRWRPERRPPLLTMLVAGLCIGLAYVLVIHAMRSMPAAVVVAFTNAGIVIAGALSIFMFHERQHWQTRLLGMAIVMAGLIMLAIARN
jgi:phosphonate utilization associated putative membrane protein